MMQHIFQANGNAIKSKFPHAAPTHSSKYLDLWAGFTRDLLEQMVALTLLITLTPLFLSLAVLIKLTSRGSVFYQQIRFGKDNHTFSILKFRSMEEQAEKECGSVLSCKGDPRLTPIGAFLRNSHIDELPQLINIIQGHMAFIGPRPERPDLAREYGRKINHYVWRSRIKPGITGLAQVCLDYDALPSEKLELDLFYLRRRRSLRMNFIIMAFTLNKVFYDRFN